MAEATVLQMVQNILSRMSSDTVNSISDTPESLQVATILQNKYYDIVARGDLSLDEQIFQLVASNDPTQPTVMSFPDTASRLDWIQYFDSNVLDSQQISQFGAYRHNLNTDIVNTVSWVTTSTTSVTIGTGNQTWTVGASLPVAVGQNVIAVSGINTMFGSVVSYSGTTLVVNISSTTGAGTFNAWVIQNSNFNSLPGYKYVDVVPLDYFLDVTNRFDNTQNNVKSYSFPYGGNTFNLRYQNNHQPSMCTVLSNQWILFDCYDSTQDSTLQSGKTLCYGQMVPTFTLSDTFVPFLDDQQFPLLLNEATSLAFYELKQMPHAKADEEIKRQWAVTQKMKSIANKPGYFDQLSNFGRVPRTGGYGGYPIYRWMRGGVGGGSKV
jgi:hypothetical protein